MFFSMGLCVMQYLGQQIISILQPVVNHEIFGVWGNTYTKMYSLFFCNVDLTGYTVFLFAQSDNPVFQSSFAYAFSHSPFTGTSVPPHQLSLGPMNSFSR